MQLVRMRARGSRGPLTHCDWCPQKKRLRDTHEKEETGGNGAEMGAMPPQAKDRQPPLGYVSISGSKRSQTAHTWILAS